MKKLLLSLAIVVAISISAVAQVVVSGAANSFTNAEAATPVASPFVCTVPAHTYSINHGGLLVTTNFSALRQVGFVDAMTGATNWTTIQQWTAANTNSSTETPTLTNFNFTIYERLMKTTTNTWNAPVSAGAITPVTNTIIY